MQFLCSSRPRTSIRSNEYKYEVVPYGHEFGYSDSSYDFNIDGLIRKQSDYAVISLGESAIGVYDLKNKKLVFRSNDDFKDFQASGCVIGETVIACDNNYLFEYRLDLQEKKE